MFFETLLVKDVFIMAPKEQFESRFIPSGVLNEAETETLDGGLEKPAGQVAEERKYVIVWRNVIIMSLLHIFGVYGAWLTFSGQSKWQTNVYGKFN